MTKAEFLEKWTPQLQRRMDKVQLEVDLNELMADERVGDWEKAPQKAEREADAVERSGRKEAQKGPKSEPSSKVGQDS